MKPENYLVRKGFEPSMEKQNSLEYSSINRDNPPKLSLNLPLEKLKPSYAGSVDSLSHYRHSPAQDQENSLPGDKMSDPNFQIFYD